MKNLILLLVLAFLYGPTAQAQITRGAQPGEIYISTDWYMDNYGKIHYAIFHSTDNGEHIALKYENIETPPSGEMTVGRVLGDATVGALYNYGNNELWVSFDYGGNWMYNEDYPDNTYYLSGIISGVIFKTSWVKLHRSDDFGQNFEIITDPLAIPVPEIGFTDGEFFGINGDSGVGFELVHTTDYANTYTEIQIDSSVAFWSIGGYWPKISRGTSPGELYLVSWWPDYHYKIFHSVDTGYTWTDKFESDYINVYYWRVAYTAGREPGSFFVLRSTVAPAGDHILLYIDYSSDYGETFTTCFHDLDSLFTFIIPITQPVFRLSAYPNPFSDKTIISFQLPNNCNAAVLSIYDISGMLIKQYNVYGNKVQQWDGCNSSGATVKSGLYFYQIKTDEYLSPLNKLMFIN